MELDTGKVSPEHWMGPASGGLLAWLICWVSLPPVSLQPTIRILFITLEAAFSSINLLHNDYSPAHLCLWNRNTLEYDGCCSHYRLNEGISGDFKLSAQQLEAQAAQRQENHRTSNKVSESKIRKSKTYYCALCKVSKVSQYRLTEHNKTPSHLRKAADLADPNKPHKCTLCNVAYKKINHLNRHNSSDRHLAALSSSQLD
jgi:hypothetical protein